MATTKKVARSKSLGKTRARAKAHDQELLKPAEAEQAEGAKLTLAPSPSLRSVDPKKSVEVPMTALCDLFDMGNYSHAYGDKRHVGALDLARNAIRHVSIELEVLGSAVNCEDPQFFNEDTATHCYRVASQMRAALQIVDAVAEFEKSNTGVYS